MGFFTRTAMDALMKTTHPEINRRQCWNLHPHRKPCTECKDICPYGEGAMQPLRQAETHSPQSVQGSQSLTRFGREKISSP